MFKDARSTRPSLSRCLCACLILLTTGLEGCNRQPAPTVRGTGLTRITLQADWYPQPEHGGFYTALVKGYYREEGLEVSIRPGGPYVVAA